MLTRFLVQAADEWERLSELEDLLARDHPLGPGHRAREAVQRGHLRV